MTINQITVEYYDGAAVFCPTSDAFVSLEHCQACKHFQSIASPEADISSGAVKVLCDFSKGGAFVKLSKQHVNHLYFVEGKTVEEIAKIAGITKQRMSQLMQDWGFFTHQRKAPVCPWRPNRVIYYRKKTDDFTCRLISKRKRARRTKGGRQA